jgi:hypothetical protein
MTTTSELAPRLSRSQLALIPSLQTRDLAPYNGKQHDSDLRSRLAGGERLSTTRYSHLGGDAVFDHLHASCEPVGAGTSHSFREGKRLSVSGAHINRLPPMGLGLLLGLRGPTGSETTRFGKHARNSSGRAGFDFTTPLPFGKATTAAVVGLGTFRVCCASRHPRKLAAKRYGLVPDNLSRLAGLCGPSTTRWRKR